MKPSNYFAMHFELLFLQMSEMVNLHFLGLIEALQECNSTILSKVKLSLLLTFKHMFFRTAPRGQYQRIKENDNLLQVTKHLKTNRFFAVVSNVDSHPVRLQQPGKVYSPERAWEIFATIIYQLSQFYLTRRH